MKTRLLLFLIPIFFASCIKQAIEDVQQQKAIDAVTKGAWYVKSYKQDSTDITNAFNGFLFYFKEDGTVRAVKDSTAMNGTWIGDISSKTITSQFQTTAEPLSLLNGTWKILDSYYDFIKASNTTDSITNNLDLRQQ